MSKVGEYDFALAGTLPPESRNGLGQIYDEMCKNPEQVHVAIVILDAQYLKIATDDGAVMPTVRIKRLELPEGADAAAAYSLFEQAHQHRTGQAVQGSLDDMIGPDEPAGSSVHDGAGDGGES